jgi:hypothetical protein
VVYCRFTGLPTDYTAFGKKTVKMTAPGINAVRSIEVFYAATATNHPGQDPNAKTPNWFYYYKQNAGATDIVYNGAKRSEVIRVEHAVKIGDEAYSGDTYFITELIPAAPPTNHPRLSFKGTSRTNRYYANFIGHLAQEYGHRDNEVTTADNKIDLARDPDADYLPDAFETGTSNTDPTYRYSARGDTSRPEVAVFTNSEALTDNEVWFGGPVEERAVKGATTTSDWAYPGTNSADAAP